MKALKSKAVALNQIHCGDAAAVLAHWPDELIDCIVTSPPYFRQRDYRGTAEQIGMEESPQQRLGSASGSVQTFSHQASSTPRLRPCLRVACELAITAEQ